jgi:hypothetical protein
MTSKPKPIVYRIEAQRLEGAAWEEVIGEERTPLLFTGPPGKARALKFADFMLRYPSWYAVRVMRGSEVVKAWAKQGGV